MTNPFEKRASEYLADTEAFLAVVTPEPLATFLKKPARQGYLYDRLVVVTGTPGSGKTTLAKLFEYATVRSLLQNKGASTYRPLADALTECAVLEDLTPQILGARVPLESEYREFWEFPYPEDLRGSLTTTLIQARTVIRWLRQLADSGVDLASVEVVPREGAEAALEQIGGSRGDEVLRRAREVERAIYGVVRALVPPAVDAIRSSAGAPYHPFDVIEKVRLPLGRTTISVTPLAMFDDAHSLHPRQYELLQRWLAQREIRIGRWVLTRLDSLDAAHVLGDDTRLVAGMQRTRVVTEIRMQSTDRGTSRAAFRKMARDMSSRYLRQMPTFNRRQLAELADLLQTERPALPESKLQTLRVRVDRVQRKVGASDARRAELESKVYEYFKASTMNEWAPELALAATAIALERFGKRTPQLSLDVFDSDAVEPNKPITINSSLIEGARIHLLHEWKVPYYVGFEALCDASSENAEQFLQLASRLVSQSETQLIRGKAPSIPAHEQDRILRKRAGELIDAWDFPLHNSVRRLTDAMATQCLRRSLEGNAPLGGGASAWGIPQEAFNALPSNHPELARILQFAVAYNALVVVTEHTTKGRKWCLLELGGPLLVRHGLTLRRGGFLEREVSDLLEAVGDSDA